MRFISTKAHGIMDYLSGILFIVSPWLFGFADGTAAQWVPIVIGIVLLLTSAITDYETGLANIISMPAHLGMDVLAGIVLIASPWLFGFADKIMWPHILFGLFEIGAGLMTKKQPYTTEILV